MAPEIGQALREARILRGIELSRVEQVTKIRTKYLCAMEEDQWELLPGPAYARGFLSTYARFLELDEKALVAKYRRRCERVEKMEPVPGEMLPKRGVVRRPSIRPGTVATGLIAAAVVGLVLGVGLPGGSGDSGEGRAKPRVRNTAAVRPPRPPPPNRS